MAQRRVRVMLLGTRRGDVVAHLPTPVAARTVGDVLLVDDLRSDPGEPTDSAERTAAWRVLWDRAATRPRDFRSLYEELGLRTRPIPGIYYRRLVADRPMGTYVAGDHCWHPVEPRPLGWRECLALCGYPLDWVVPNLGAKSASSLLARAVLPPVGEAAARALLAAARAGGPPRPGLTIVDHRDPTAPIPPRAELL
jgi:site-specific DNA-cytosine methylase